jgi:two-component system cell cycle sensor histidine kinase/response regulator CckA
MGGNDGRGRFGQGTPPGGGGVRGEASSPEGGEPGLPERRERLLRAVAFIPEQLLRHPDLNRTIPEVLARLGEAARVSRVYVFENHLDDDGCLLTSQRYEWVAPGITPTIDAPELQNLPAIAAGFGRWVHVLGEGRPVHGLVRDFPEDERAILEPQEIRSIVVMPIPVEGAFWGFVGFDDCVSDRVWDADELETLRAAADSLGAAFERRRLEEAVQESEARFRAVFEQAANGFLLVEPETTRIVAFNARAHTNLGYSREEFAGLTISDLDADESPERVAEHIGEVLRDGAAHFETRHRTQRGELRDMQVHAQIIMAGGRRYLLSMCHDVTERKQAERVLKESEARLGQLQRMESLGTLVGGIAHNFNNILNAQLNCLYVARRQLGHPEEADEKLALAEDLCLKAAETVAQLLAFARQRPMAVRRMRLSGLMEDALAVARMSIPENVRLDVSVPGVPYVIRGDSGQLQQVLVNLLTNARDAVEGRPHPVIHLAAEVIEPDGEFLKTRAGLEGERFVCLRVEDNGCGIPPENLGRVFEPFFTTKEVGRGSGLGLAMSHGAVRMHGGLLEVESEPGLGTVFRVYLPLTGVGAQEGTEAVPREPTFAGRGETILVADDEADLRETLAEALASVGYQVVTAADGEEAVDRFAADRDHVALVLLDVVMPRLSGVDAARRIRAINANVPLILATGYEKQRILEEARAWSRTLVLAKPLPVPALSRRIRELLESRPAASA